MNETPAVPTADPNPTPKSDHDGQPPVPPELLDAFSKIIGAGRARLLRVLLAGVIGVGTKHGLGLNADNPYVNLVLDSFVTGVMSGIGKTLRDGKITLGTKVWNFPGWIPKLPGWFPI